MARWWSTLANPRSSNGRWRRRASASSGDSFRVRTCCNSLRMESAFKAQGPVPGRRHHYRRPSRASHASDGSTSGSSGATGVRVFTREKQRKRRSKVRRSCGPHAGLHKYRFRISRSNARIKPVSKSIRFPPAFSFPFHKEVSTSTGFAQRRREFPLPLETKCEKVHSLQA